MLQNSMLGSITTNLLVIRMMEVFMDWLYISKDDGGSEPFFMAINADMDKVSKNHLNTM